MVPTRQFVKLLLATRYELTPRRGATKILVAFISCNAWYVHILRIWCKLLSFAFVALEGQRICLDWVTRKLLLVVRRLLMQP